MYTDTYLYNSINEATFNITHIGSSGKKVCTDKVCLRVIINVSKTFYLLATFLKTHTLGMC